MNCSREFRTARSLAEYVLARSVRARNDDKWFLVCCLKAQGLDVSTSNGKVSWIFTPEELGAMYSFETLTRVRRELQNDYCKYLPEQKVAESRYLREAAVQEYYS